MRPCVFYSLSLFLSLNGCPDRLTQTSWNPFFLPWPWNMEGHFFEILRSKSRSQIFCSSKSTIISDMQVCFLADFKTTPFNFGSATNILVQSIILGTCRALPSQFFFNHTFHPEVIML